ncbi:MAG: VTC domain-containing protein [Lachnospiraceae bacterium]|nr:VTC domain-containing protein [Lachnospiraceae bacterium]
MANQTIFKRYEYKYLLTADQKKDLLAYMETYMKPDTFGRNTICNLYFDTPDYFLIRRSIEGKVYKEKIRLRTYGRAQDDSEAFIELKKKYKKVVYKRRVRTEYADAVRYLCQGEDSIEHSQIRRELDYAMQMYQGIRPAVYLSYEREAFYGKDDHELRITFDQNILWRTTQLDLSAPVYGRPLLEKNQTLMEIKVGQGGPGKSDMQPTQDAGTDNGGNSDTQNGGTDSSTDETSKNVSVKKTGTETGSAKSDSEAAESTTTDNTATGSEIKNSSTTEATSTTADTSTKGIKASGDLLVKDGTFTIDSCDDSFHTNGNMTICGGTYALSTGDDGMHADEANQVYGGEITIETCYEGIEGQNVEISGGTIDITASDDGLNAAGGNDQSGMGGFGGDMFSADEDSWITISGGTVTIDATGDGIDSNGNLTVSGGTICVSGPSDNGNGALDYNGTATITGGTLVAVGMSGMAQNFGSDSTQGSLLVNLTDNQSGEITLEDGDDNTLLSYTPVREYNSVVISCTELSDGSTYTIHTGENSQEVTMDGLVYTDGEAANAPGQGGGQMPQGGPMGENNDNSDNSDGSDRPTPPQGQGTPPDMQNGERPQGGPPQGNPGDSSNEQTKEESDGQK